MSSRYGCLRNKNDILCMCVYIMFLHLIGCEVAVEEDHRSQLTYTRAFLYEVMRIKPIAPLSIGHMTTCDTSVGKNTYG